VTYAAGEGAARAESVYTVYAGLEMFMTAAAESTAFVGEAFTLPACRPLYKYKDGDATRYIDVSAARGIVFYPADGGSVPVTADGETLVPAVAGRYEFVFTSSDTIEENGVTFVNGAVQRRAGVTVYAGRSNPLSGADGLYQCGYTVGGTSETGVGMINSSCKNTVQIEKRGCDYYLYFTVATAQYIGNTGAAQNGRAVPTLTVDEHYEGADLHATAVFALTGKQLGEPLDMQMDIIPMDRTVNFTVTADLANAYGIGGLTGGAPAVRPLPDEAGGEDGCGTEPDGAAGFWKSAGGIALIAALSLGAAAGVTGSVYLIHKRRKQ
jgi:hypothetical protein